MEFIKNEGVEIGKYKGKIDVQTLINKIRIARDDVAWVGMEIKGTNLIIEVVEADKKPEIIDPEDYCNIISDKEGVITKITTQNGTALVKPGDVVKKGTILIGGWIEGKYTGTRYLHSEGEIQAKVWYSKKEKMSLNQDVDTKTRGSRK